MHPQEEEGGLASLARPETKVTALKLLSAAAKKAPREVEGMMTTLVPVVSKAMWDVKKVVKEQAEETLEDICGSIDNIDVSVTMSAARSLSKSASDRWLYVVKNSSRSGGLTAT